jgi:ribosome-binding protein aMBF1 (putative translation factor)
MNPVMIAVGKRAAKRREMLLIEAQAIDEQLTLIRGKSTSNGMAQHKVTAATALVIAWQDWKDDCPIRQARCKKGLTQSMLAALARVNLWTVTRWEAGGMPSALHCAALEEILGVKDLAKATRAWKAKVPR